jgi:hypothetical protein
MARRRLYTTHNIYMLGCIHITLTECTFVFCAPSSIQCLQALPTIINLFIVESDNIFVAKDFYSAQNIKQEIVTEYQLSHC